jgi:hypothetical protein
MRLKARQAFLSRFSDKSAFDAFDALLGTCASPRPAADERSAGSRYVSSTAGPARAL